MRLKQDADQGDRVVVKRPTNKECAVSYLNSLNVRRRSDVSGGARVLEVLNGLLLAAIRCSLLTACLQSISGMNLRVLRSIRLLKAKLTKSATTRNTKKLITCAIKTLKIAEPATI